MAKAQKATRKAEVQDAVAQVEPEADVPEVLSFAQKREPVILRVRMKRGLFMRLKNVVRWQRRSEDGWTMSTATREAILQWLEPQERLMHMMQSVGPHFTGNAPAGADVDAVLAHAADELPIAAKN